MMVLHVEVCRIGVKMHIQMCKLSRLEIVDDEDYSGNKIPMWGLGLGY